MSEFRSEPGGVGPARPEASRAAEAARERIMTAAPSASVVVIGGIDTHKDIRVAAVVDHHGRRGRRHRSLFNRPHGSPVTRSNTNRKACLVICITAHGSPSR